MVSKAYIRWVVGLSLVVILGPLVAFSQGVVGVISAVPSEAKTIVNAMKHLHQVKKGLYVFERGTIAKQPVVLVVSGAGIVNAAVATTTLIQQFNPKMVIFSGTAGAIDHHLNVGDVVIVKQALSYDMGDQHSLKPRFPNFGNNVIRHEHDRVYFDAAKVLIQRAQALSLKLNAINHLGKNVPAKLVPGRIATTDHFPNGEADYRRMKRLKMTAVAMETASMMKVCWLYHKPCIAFRGIGDLVNAKPSRYTSWNHHNAVLAADNAANVTIRFIAAH